MTGKLVRMCPHNKLGHEWEQIWKIRRSCVMKKWIESYSYSLNHFYWRKKSGKKGKIYKWAKCQPWQLWRWMICWTLYYTEISALHEPCNDIILCCALKVQFYWWEPPLLFSLLFKRTKRKRKWLGKPLKGLPINLELYSFHELQRIRLTLIPK